MSGLPVSGLILALGGLALAAPATPASAAGKYDGSKPMLCAVTAVSECTKDGNCERSAPQEGNNLPGWKRPVGLRVPGSYFVMARYIDRVGNATRATARFSIVR